MEYKKCGSDETERSRKWHWLTSWLQFPLARFHFLSGQRRTAKVKTQNEPQFVVRKKFKVERRRYEDALPD